MWRRLKEASGAGRAPVTVGPVVGQAWRGARPRPALLARALAGVEVLPVDDVLGRAAGELLGATRTSDVVDASLALVALDGDVVLTSDPDDLARLAATAGLDVEIVRV